MTDTTTVSPDDLKRLFPAKYSPSIITAIIEELQARLLHSATILDPFAGIGGIHELADELPCRTVGIDIEPEQAALHPRTILGDSMQVESLLPQLREAALGPDGHRHATDLFDVVVTSPAYGNRLADQYLGSDGEKCRPCDGTGKATSIHRSNAMTNADGTISMDVQFGNEAECKKCGGTGKAKSKRMGYAIALDRILTEGSGAKLGYGARYKELHAGIVGRLHDTINPRWWMVNVSSSLDSDGYNDVMEWWVETLAKVATIEKVRAIPTPRIRFGANSERRVPVEHLIIARRP